MANSLDTEIIYSKSFDNVTLIDPNKILNSNGYGEDRNVKQENLVMYANLECNVSPRSRLMVGEKSQTLETVGIAKVNFLKPNNQDYLTTNWTELQSNYSNPNTINSELLGITNISYRASQEFIPMVNITLEDIRGRALFESEDNSVYSVFFNLPYPTFYLTLKGFYGKALRMPLILQKFNASLDQTSGNFIINLNFIGYQFNVLTDITLGYIKSVPLMYQRQINQRIETEPAGTEQASIDQINSNSVTVNSFQSSEGRDMMNQVYATYKKLGLVDEKFPELTVYELISKLESFEKKYQELLGQVETDSLTDAKNFDSILTNFAQDVMIKKNPNSWRYDFLDTTKYYVTLEKNKRIKVYTYNKDIFNNLKFDDAISKLNSIINDYSKKLEDAPTFGVKGGKGERRISVNIKQRSIVPEPYWLPNADKIDIAETARERFGVASPTNSQLNIISNELKTLDNLRVQIEQQRSEAEPPKQPIEIPFLFKFEGDNFFLDEINKAKKSLNLMVQDIELDLTAKINNLLKSDNGIGFEPNIRNIFAVIMASTDAFLRLMDKVHLKAFDVRNDNRKKQSVISDVKDEPDSPVFPWPEYNKQILVDGEPKYDLKYPGDPDYVNETGANNYEVWPEVQFVEEFQKAYLERLPEQLKTTPSIDNQSVIRRLLVSGFDTPSNKPYSDLQITPFLYEIWERVQAICHYQGFARLDKYETILNFIQAFEASNIKLGIGTNSDELLTFLKEYKFTPENYQSTLSENAPQTYEFLLRGEYTTPYLRDEILNNTKFLTEDIPETQASISTEKEPAQVEDSINKYLKSTDKDSLYFTDILPFASIEWNKDNLNDGNNNSDIKKVFDTTKSLFYNQKNKKIVNYLSNTALNGTGENSKNRPFNYFVSTSSEIPYNLVKTDMKSFYNERVTNPSKSSYTEGRVDDFLSDLNIKSITTSVLNTPNFMNSIHNGVAEEKNGNPNPYIQASWLFLNSLPLTNLKWQYTNSDGTKNNYVGPSFVKYGAIHSLPKLWVAKIGSIWHRYKTWIETGVDILETINGPLNAPYYYDPANSDPSTTYNFSSVTIVNETTQGPTVETTTTAVTQNFTIKLNSTIIDQNLIENEIVTVGFYPQLLNDFYYFLNGEDLYLSVVSLQDEIQSAIDNGNVILLNNSDSLLSLGAGYDPNNPTKSLIYSTISVLFKNIAPNVNNNNPGEYYFSAPSFGSRYSQVKDECFSGTSLTKNVYGNQSVFNGSTRFFWGGTHFGYLSSINKFSNPDAYISRSRANKWGWNLILTSFGTNESSDYVEDLFGSFTKEELDLFEQQFLEFSKSEKQTTNTLNLQTILKRSLQVNKNDFYNKESNNLIENFQKAQQISFNSSINSFINENILLQKGNPTNFNYFNFSYFTPNPLKGTKDNVLNYIDNTPNAVPVSGGTQNLVQSKEQHPDAWRALETYVGFSSISGVSYYGNSSTILDFFPDFNIAFNADNVIRFASIIKIYATQKYLGNARNAERFQVMMTQFVDSLNDFRDWVFDGTYTKTQNSLPNVTNTKENEDNSKTVGDQTKLEYYYLFKSINDKWVAANNYNTRTLFEDILFLDRGSKNLGGQIIVDIFEVIKFLKDDNTKPIHSIIESLVRHHHFVPYNLPSFMNFYGAQNAGDERVDESEESFANKIFGTHMEVDYMDSKPKMVCYYAETGSEQLNNKSQTNGFKDDSWNFELNTDNPVVENLSLKESKNDWGISNKVVGLAVDFGVQNQNIFKTIQVSQDLGKATSESLAAEYGLGQITKGTNTMVQNVSLYQIYKTRAYQATITCMGNAMIQPMMFFVLRNMPLFAGPYLITEIEHIITSSDFTTKMVGTRQKTYTPPIQNKLLETIKSTFVSKLINDLQTKRESEKKVEENTIQERNSVSNNINNNITPTQNPICRPNVYYGSYTAVTTPQQQSTSVRDVQDSILNKIRSLNGGNNSGDDKSYIVYTLFYIKSYKGNSFQYFENNPAFIPISPSVPKWSDISKLFNPNYACLTGANGQTDAYASFPNLDNAIEFAYKKYSTTFDFDLKNVANENVFVTGFTKTWIEKFPYDKTERTANLYESFKSTNPADVTSLEERVRSSYKQIKSYLNTY